MKYAVIAVSALVILVVAFATVKKVSPVAWGWWGATNTADGVALHGYDPVSYFEQGGPVAGSPEHSFEWREATWYFSSPANRDRFAADPEAFAPQFGGFCAFAVSKGFTADPMPDAWHIEDGRLYVFADQGVRDDWVETLGEGSLEQSRANWSKRH